MAIALETHTNNDSTPSPGASNTMTGVDVGTNSDRYLLVAIAWFNFTDEAHTVCAYDGNAMTLLAEHEGPNVGHNGIKVFGQKNPTSGSNTLQVTFASAPDEGPCIIAQPCYNVLQGADDNAGVRDTDTGEANATNATVDLTLAGMVSGDHTFMFSYSFEDAGGATIGDGMTLIADFENTGGADRCSIVGSELVDITGPSQSSMDYPVSVAAALIPSVAGGISKPILMHNYRQLRIA